jgi:hypothetical protein
MGNGIVTVKGVKINKQVVNVRITTDEDMPDKVRISLLDQNGELLEGGTFDLGEFIDHVLAFYNKNF